MFTRDSAIDYSNTLIHKLVYECARTGMTRTQLCSALSLSDTALAMWLTGSRTCQQFWIVRNAELLLDELSGMPDGHYKHNK